MRFHTSFVTTLCILTHTSTCLGAAMDLDDARRRYEVAAAGIEERYQTNIASIVKAYSDALVSLRNNYQRAGNFDATQAVINEQNRLDAEACLPSSLPASVLEVINKARIAKELIAKQQQVRDRELYALALRYQDMLKQMLQNLLPQNKMEDAKAVDDELKKVAFTAADLGSRLVEHAPERSTPMRPGKKEPASIQTAAARKPPSGVLTEAELKSLKSTWTDPDSDRIYQLRAAFEQDKASTRGKIKYKVLMEYFWYEKDPLRMLHPINMIDERVWMYILDEKGEVVYQKSGNPERLTGETGYLPMEGEYSLVIYAKRKGDVLVGARVVRRFDKGE